MEPVTPTASASIAKIIASILALSASNEPLVQVPLPMQVETPAEVLVMQEPVGFAMVEGQFGTLEAQGAMGAADAARFADYTARHIGENVGFVVCGVELMAPRVTARIEGGQFVISGGEPNAAMLGFLENGCP